jgi:hypothetical protein
LECRKPGCQKSLFGGYLALHFAEFGETPTDSTSTLLRLFKLPAEDAGFVVERSAGRIILSSERL